jgi:hypothetical protein
MVPRGAMGKKRADRGPTITRAVPSRTRRQTRHRSPSAISLCQISKGSPNQPRRRSSIWGVNPISGTSKQGPTPGLESRKWPADKPLFFRRPPPLEGGTGVPVGVERGKEAWARRVGLFSGGLERGGGFFDSEGTGRAFGGRRRPKGKTVNRASPKEQECVGSSNGPRPNPDSLARVRAQPIRPSSFKSEGESPPASGSCKAEHDAHLACPSTERGPHAMAGSNTVCPSSGGIL